MQRQLKPLPHTLEVTHPDNPIWPASNIQKDDYLLYLQHVAPYMLPFLRDRLLTVIRDAFFPSLYVSFYVSKSPDGLPLND
ncbi:hypothetical protein ACQKM9_21550 [Viridibacillus sp. NPDC093762]|uniref:hypothetical protein n=1 Tax=Viridibacillus sp. NPDC093762 TaxID=3390720 RepID=UPI003D04555A